MSIEWVLDASVLIKCFVDELDSEIAKREVAAAKRLIAPDFIRVELASIAAKKIRRGEVLQHLGERAVSESESTLDELVPSTRLAHEAFSLAIQHGVSVYDGLYLALAMERDVVVLTADLRLVARTQRAGLGRFVCALPDV